ncbi:Predicted arabinose efflux permease, MFS family [Cnuella takakiae]|uniref:Predicted arabinose efflux permease, MFS family n=1 Tax=Cnuella takakiae TaxID=1302690 RepID=A0A1M4Y824_9BACT|nr:MFS transporter [Cnuella takakiae]OLY93074.1 MFS transporter [Cnuella takakiae]SHF01733.1 Predicted arabinose efflux permease, MFS family [Cnuella takakiae]
MNQPQRKGFFQRKESLAPLSIAEYRFYIFTRFFYIMALRMVATVVAYQLFQITRSSFSIGLVGLSEFVPVFALALYAGHVIDRSDKRTLLLKGILGYSICVAALVVLSMPQVAKSLGQQKTTWLIYGVVFFTGMIRSFAGPTSNAILAQLVPKDILHYAANFSSTTWLVASITGHATAGFFIAWFGVNTTFIIILAYILIAAFFVSRISRKPIAHNNVHAKVWDSVKEGLQFVFRHKIMLGAISLDLFAVLFGGAVALIPEFAERILNVGPIGFGWLNAAIDIGSGAMITLFTFFPLRRNQGKYLMYAVAGFGICIIVFGLSDIYWISFVALVIAGMLDGISVLVRGTVLQLTTPDEMRGRVSSVNSMFINSSNELGQFESGFVARIMGARPAVIFGGCMTLLVVIITWFKAPGLRKFEY